MARGALKRPDVSAVAGLISGTNLCRLGALPGRRAAGRLIRRLVTTAMDPVQMARGRSSWRLTPSPKAAVPSRPLLIVDGDSFAHRAYHGLPKTIVGVGGQPAGAIVGFANFLLRMVEQERPRAVLVGWDTLDVPTYRHRAFPAYQSGRHFDKELLVQLDLLPRFVAACGFANAKAA